MARPFNAPNEQLPECVEKLAAHPPWCFDRASWIRWLMSTWASVLNEPATRAAMQRGRVPDYCEECTEGHRALRMRQGLCAPPLTSPAAELVYGRRVIPIAAQAELFHG